jgi:hypothetical protein
MVRMKAAAGSTVVSFGNQVFRVAEDGTIEVPDDAVQVLISHGYTEIVVPVVKMPRGRPRKAKADEVQEQQEQIEA